MLQVQDKVSATSSGSPSSSQIIDHLISSDYDRQRFDPKVADPYYLHLSDLHLGLREVLAGVRGRWLDFGSNSSPYKHLFDECELQRADIFESPGLDYLITPGESCPAPDSSFDGILSTQVLEHVPDAGSYLRDCRRMLKDSGTLVLSTHGIWEDHGCPQDYWRWTADGLRAQLEGAGFEVERCLKVTCETRALLQLLIQRSESFRYRKRLTPVGFALHLAGTLCQAFRGQVARYADRALPDFRLSESPYAKLYLCLLVVARNPGG